jgi:hypothetical protein
MPRSTPRDENAIKAVGFYHVECYDKDGNLKWSEDAQNALMDEGEFAILDIALRGGTAPANWFIGLMKNTLTVLPAETSTLASLNTAGPYELTNASDAGYSARQQVNRDATASGWPTLSLNGGDYQATSKTVTWTATGNWADTVRWLFLTTIVTVGDTTGKLISLAQLSADRTLLSGDSLNITYNLKLQ